MKICNNCGRTISEDEQYALEGRYSTVVCGDCTGHVEGGWPTEKEFPERATGATEQWNYDQS